MRDENGKRRFHGAFTGGFSAGFWNTVGSLEGWKPSEFKSSRAEKAQRREQKASDFMDEEDLGEFGIAPQRVQTREDFSRSGTDQSRKRKFEKVSTGPIPGLPVLETLLAPTRDKIAVRIFKTMGWKDGQGVGARLTRKEKKRARERNVKEMYVMKKYGCDMGPFAKPQSESIDGDNDSDSDLSDYEITFAPDDFDPFVISVKENTFGLGYSGLNRDPVLKQSINLFDTLEVVDRKTNKKLSIKGKAFGVGALEEDDEDIYERDDMSRYDFALDDPRQKKPLQAIKSGPESGVLEGFKKSKENKKAFQKIFKIDIPKNFIPRNWLFKKSRFDALPPEIKNKLESDNLYKKKGLGRHDLKPEERGKLLDDRNSGPSTSKIDQIETKKSSLLDKIVQKSNSFTTGGVMDTDLGLKTKSTTSDMTISLEKENKELIQKANKLTEGLNQTSVTPGEFKPFAMNPEKQSRYEQFRDFQSTPEQTAEDFLRSIQPLGISNWERELEKKEFTHAKRLYKPLVGLMSERFVTEGTIDKQVPIQQPILEEKIVIKMVRTKVLWKPHKELCKKFNVPEPFGGLLIEEKPIKKTKFSVFDYIETPTNSRSNFHTPVVYPKKASSRSEKKDTPRVSAKEFFNEEVKIVVPKLFQANENEAKDSDGNKSDILMPSSSIAKPMFNVPKTELELKVEESRNKRPEEKKDLFKSIFCDSSDEDDDQKEIEKSGNTSKEPSSQKNMNEEEKLKLVESFVAVKSASDFNILRNQSPPRGVFKNIFDITGSNDKKLNKKSNEKSSDSSSDSSSDDESESRKMEVECYGPRLPTNLSSSSRSITENIDLPRSSSKLDEKLSQLLSKGKSKIVVEEWVEKGKESSKKKKKKEKHKKSKKHKHVKKKKSKK